MTNIRIGLRIGLAACCMIGWWGVLYPELIMTADTYRVVDADAAVQDAGEVLEYESDEEFYRQLLRMDQDQLRFSSRLYTWAVEYLQKKAVK